MKLQLFFCLACAVQASDPVTTPVLGLLQTGGELRRIDGVPGAMDFRPLSVPDESQRTRAAARHEWMLIEQGGGSLIWDWQRNRTHSLPFAAADRVAFSPSGREAAFFWMESMRLVVLTGLPDAARVLRDEYRPELSERVRHLGVSDRGASVAAATESGKLLLLTEGAMALEIYRSDAIAALAFVPDDSALLVSDRIQNSVLRLKTGLEPEVLLSSQNGLDEPGTLWAGRAGRLAVVSAKRELLWTRDREDGEWEVDVVAGVFGLEEMQLRDTLLLVSEGGDGIAIRRFGGEQKVFALPGREH